MELANSIVTLQPGMYILRHPKTGLPPISISRAAGKKEHNGAIQALYTPGTDGSVLRDGRDCIVMQVLNAPVDLLVTAYLENAGGAVPALKVDKIALDGDAVQTKKVIEVPATGISIIGHIERTGDVLVPGGQVLGDPQGNLRLEGFQLMWPDKPDNIELTYSARTEGGPSTSPVPVGKFCGSRSAAMRIVQVRFELSGPDSDAYALDGTAYFSGGFESQITSGIFLNGPSGSEHLVGLALTVSKATSPAPSKSPWDASNRTKVFKGTKLGAKK